MKIKNMLLASMIAGASLFGTSAFAADIGKTSVVTLDDDGLGGFAATLGATFNSAAMGKTFSDFYTFTLSDSYDSSASLTSTYLNKTTLKDLLITGFSLVKYDASNAVVQTYMGTNTTASGSHVDKWELNGLPLSAGKYAIEIDGKVLGNAGGSYASDLNVSIAAVPEPETYGMMVVGLGLLGVVARRRKQA
ncbi:FxDxF family PEP-CTERM protein [Duganella sp. Dugasp56]|uniref:FxDxF family PEP-CTERM protein n=1 Tax=Duganella sp. Dugasp56 TaxID=3243046 RepID=UPI0039B0BB7B